MTREKDAALLDQILDTRMDEFGADEQQTLQSGAQALRDMDALEDWARIADDIASKEERLGNLGPRILINSALQLIRGDRPMPGGGNERRC